MGSIVGGGGGLVLDTNYIAGVVTVSTIPTPLRASISNLEGRDMIIVYNKSTSIIYIGPSGVTTANGIKVVPEQILNINLRDNITLYAVLATGTADIVVQEVG